MRFPGRVLASIQLSAIAELVDIWHMEVVWASVNCFPMAVWNVLKETRTCPAVSFPTNVDELALIPKGICHNIFNCKLVHFHKVAVLTDTCALLVIGAGKCISGFNSGRRRRGRRNCGRRRWWIRWLDWETVLQRRLFRVVSATFSCSSFVFNLLTARVTNVGSISLIYMINIQSTRAFRTICGFTDIPGQVFDELHSPAYMFPGYCFDEA